MTNAPKPEAVKPKDPKDKKQEEEEDEVKQQVELCVTRIKESGNELAISSLKNLIKQATTSMTSVPKPIKYLMPHQEELTKLSTPRTKGINDILSVLGMTNNTSLSFVLKGCSESLDFWGHEYMRHLAMEIIQTYQDATNKDQLVTLAKQLVPHFLENNAEHDACDLLLELEHLDFIVPLIKDDQVSRVALYLTSCHAYTNNTLGVVHDIHIKFSQYCQALNVAIRLNDVELIKKDFESVKDKTTKMQMAFILARQFVLLETPDEQLQSILNNADLSKHFLSLARDLDILEPKSPNDVYKSQLEKITTDSARLNLASTFVNAFVNAGFGTDKLLLTEKEESGSWIYKNKEHGMTSATASIGALMLWDVEGGLSHLDKYLYSTDVNVKAGALLGIGIGSCGVRNESDPAVALLSEHVEDDNLALRLASIAGLGLAYSGSAREDIAELLTGTMTDSALSAELSGQAALSLGLTFVATAHGDLTSSLLQTLMERDDAWLKSKDAKMFIVALGLLYLGKQDLADAVMETLKAIEHPISKQAQVFVEACAYAGCGDVLKIQAMLHHCTDHIQTAATEESSKDDKKDGEEKVYEDDQFQAFATLGIALIAMGEDIGATMVLRTFAHLMQYCEPVIRRTVPLALGLLSASNPQLGVLDTLSKYSHDTDTIVAMNATFAMGIVGAGTNNARLAQVLRQLAQYHAKDPNALFMVRIAQGLLHLGKGTLTLNPFHSNRFLMSNIAVGGLLATLTKFMFDPKLTILDKQLWMLYYLVPAMYPRFLVTLDEELKPLSTSVRVGQAVDVVGKAGRAKAITAFQTHSTPVLLSYTDRAEMATEEFKPVASVMEGFVILKKNPKFEPAGK